MKLKWEYVEKPLKKEVGIIIKIYIVMAMVILSHKILDYNRWRPAFDADTQRRNEAGFKNVTVYRSAEDPNNIYILGETDDPSKLASMMSDPNLGELMEKAGVISKPSVIVLNKA